MLHRSSQLAPAPNQISMGKEPFHAAIDHHHLLFNSAPILGAIQKPRPTHRFTMKCQAQFQTLPSDKFLGTSDDVESFIIIACLIDY